MNSFEFNPETGKLSIPMELAEIPQTSQTTAAFAQEVTGKDSTEMTTKDYFLVGSMLGVIALAIGTVHVFNRKPRP